MRKFILWISLLINFATTQLVISLINWPFNITSYSILFWIVVIYASVLFMAYSIVLLDWYFYSNLETIPITTQRLLMLLENIKWFGLPSLIVNGIVGFLNSYNRFWNIIPSLWDKVQTMINDFIYYIVNKLKEL